MRYLPACLPSPIAVALARSAPRSLPACGSVRFIVPDQAPLTRCGRYLAFCAALPWCSSASIAPTERSEEHTSELQSLMRISYAVFCLKHKKSLHIITIAYTHNNYPHIIEHKLK